MSNIPAKKVTLELVGLDGNAFALLGAFSKQARKEGWSEEEFKAVLTECMSGDYNHLLATLMSVCESPKCDEDDDDSDYCDNCGEHLNHYGHCVNGCK